MNDRFMCRIWDKKLNERILPMGILDSNEDDLIFEQCTGLRDKNGKLIYEGDIVKDVFDERPVIWCKECGGFQLAYSKDCLECMACAGDDFFVDLNKEDIEIVGNIHENKDLFEVVDD